MLWGHVIAGKQLQLVTDKKKKKSALNLGHGEVTKICMLLSCP